MKLKYALISLAVGLALLLSACSRPESPLEVSQAFWQAVIEGNVPDVVKYSTLGSEEGYEAFSRDWTGMLPSWGKIIIEEHTARVHTHISKPDAAQSEMLYFVTYLVRQDDQWKVDYDRTEKVVLASSAVSDFVNRINTIGNEISQQFETASQTVTAELEGLNKQLKQLTESLGNQATATVEKYSKILQQHLDALASSIDKAIKEQDSSISPGDRKKMEETVTALDKSSKKLAQPDMTSIAETGEVIVITRKNLETIDSGTFQEYQAQWQQWINEVNVDLVNLLKEISAEIK
ncbi:MAG: hypothetical protein U9N50_01480 [Pseudomonadota bacterium]|nr:hypothetical protein [Pseudomonadota bacterium]